MVRQSAKPMGPAEVMLKINWDLREPWWGLEQSSKNLWRFNMYDDNMNNTKKISEKMK